MKYFVRDCDRTSTVYHEFQKGHFDGVRFWKEIGGEIRECMKETDVRGGETFAEYNVFTMIGL